VAHAIDDQPQSGWAIDSADGNMNVNRTAQFWFDHELSLDGFGVLEVVLRNDRGQQHNLGRFRISAIRQDYPESDAPIEERREQFLQQGLAAWITDTAAKAADWTILNPVTYRSEKTATLERLDDRSILATGEFPNIDTYVVQYRIDEPVTALRLEALPHESLPGGGPGRGMIMSPDGDFFLSEVRLKAAPWSDPENTTDLALGTPTASFASGGRGIENTIDGAVETGWGINGKQGEEVYAVFPLAETLYPQPGGTLITLELEHFNVHQHTLGRFRISATWAESPVESAGVPAAIEALIAAGTERWADADRDAVRDYYLTIAPELANEHAAIDAMRDAMPQYPTTYTLVERTTPRETRIHHRGEYLSPREPVQPGTPAVLHEFPESWPRDRLAFARWLTMEDNPLLARVAVNRVWQSIFGTGLVETTEDFGIMASPPTHPELLDWLAVEFMRRGWSTKELHRLIVLSATYRQDSAVDARRLEFDPENKLLARGPRFRVPAELVRDVALASSGLLSEKMGGPSVFPPLSPEILEVMYTEGRDVWPTSEGEDRFRRGVYTYIKRVMPYPSAMTFGMPARDVSCPRRPDSNTPLQALTLLNNSEFFVAAQALAERVLTEAPAEFSTRLNHAYMLVLSRTPDDTERAAMRQFIETHQQRFANGEADPAPLVGDYEVEGIDTAEQAAWVGACRALLNLDEAITKT